MLVDAILPDQGRNLLISVKAVESLDQKGIDISKKSLGVLKVTKPSSYQMIPTDLKTS